MKKHLLYDESRLLQQLAKGNSEAFAAIYDRFFALIFYYVKRRLGDAEKANDVTSDCFLKFWRGGKKDFDSLEGVKAYLLRAVSNACINAHRDMRTEMVHQEQILYQLRNSDDIALQEKDEYKAALMNLVLEEIERLPKQCKLVFSLAYFEEMKNEEIAEKLQLSHKTVRNQKNRALNLLRLAFMEKKISLSCLLIILFQKAL